MSKKKIMMISILMIFILLIIFILSYYKTEKIGNTINKSTDDIVKNILNLNSYEAEIEVIVESNKTTNQYCLQQYYVKPNIIKQTVKEPKNLENLTILYDGKNMKVENTNLSLSKLYQDYEYISTNMLWLHYFIDQYSNKSNIQENQEEIIIENHHHLHQYNDKQILYINKKTNLPTKLEIQDNNKNNKIYIKYKEIKLNKTKQEEILAFQLRKVNI